MQGKSLYIGIDSCLIIMFVALFSTLLMTDRKEALKARLKASYSSTSYAG